MITISARADSCARGDAQTRWHVLLRPACDGESTAFMQRLTITHVRRWQEQRGYAGLGQSSWVA